jgi:hypothetical protein
MLSDENERFKIFTSISEQFYQMIKVSTIPDNGIYHAYAKINYCADELKLVINQLVRLLKKLNYLQEAIHIKLLKTRINNVIRGINEWGFDENHDSKNRFNEDLSVSWIDLQKIPYPLKPTKSAP